MHTVYLPSFPLDPSLTKSYFLLLHKFGFLGGHFIFQFGLHGLKKQLWMCKLPQETMLKTPP